jgi:hypothetical protein
LDSKDKDPEILHKLLDFFKFNWTGRDHELLANLNLIPALHQGSELLKNSWLINIKPQPKVNYVFDLFETLMIKIINRVVDGDAE